MCAAIEAGQIDFDAVASTDTSPGFLPVANLPRFRRAFEARLRDGSPDPDAPPWVGAFEGPFVEDEPTPSSSAQLVVPVPDATGAAPPGLVMVPGLLDESDEHDQDATSDNASTGHITDRDTLVGGDTSEGHDTFIQSAAPADATADLDAERAEADAIADRADAAAFGAVGGFAGFATGEAPEGVAPNRDAAEVRETAHSDGAHPAASSAHDAAARRPRDGDPHRRAAFTPATPDVPPPDASVPSLDSDAALRSAFAPAEQDRPSFDSDPGLRTAFAPAGHDVPPLDSDSGLRTAFAPAGHDVPPLDSDPGLRTAFAGHDVPPLDSDSGLRTAFGVLLDHDPLGPATDPASPPARLHDPGATNDAAAGRDVRGGDAAAQHPAAARPPTAGRVRGDAVPPAPGTAPAPPGSAGRLRPADAARPLGTSSAPPETAGRFAHTGDAATGTADGLLEDTEDDAPGLTLPHTRVTPDLRPPVPADADREPPTLRPGDATAVGVRTVVGGRPDDRDLDTLVGGGLPDGLERATDSGVRVSGADIDEVHPTDTQVAVVHPDEDFQPEDLALTSQDDPMPPEHTPPPADAAPIAHGAIAVPTPAARSMVPLWIVLGAWALLTATMFFASVARDGGHAEAAWRPASAVLWLRIALTGGVGGLLALALKRALPVTKQLLRLSWEWAGIAILAGACVGAMAPFSRPEAPLAIALILAATLAIAEEAFFRGVLGRVLAVSPLRNRTAIAIAAIAYGVYYGTYFVIWQHDDPLQTALALTMITVGAALPYAILQDLTKGVLAPLLCHVSVNVAGVVVRTYF